MTVEQANPRLMRRAMAAKYIAVSVPTFDRWAKDGRLPRAKMIGAIRAWDRADLDRYVDALPREGAAQDEGA